MHTVRVYMGLSSIYTCSDSGIMSHDAYWYVNCAAAAGGDRAPGLQRRFGHSAHPPGLI